MSESQGVGYATHKDNTDHRDNDLHHKVSYHGNENVQVSMP